MYEIRLDYCVGEVRAMGVGAEDYESAVYAEVAAALGVEPGYVTGQVNRSALWSARTSLRVHDSDGRIVIAADSITAEQVLTRAWERAWRGTPCVFCA